MTAPRDPDLTIASWLDDGPYRLPEPTKRAIQVSTRTLRQSRRPTWLPWRFLNVNGNTKLALGGATVLAVAVGGLYFVNRGPAGAGSGEPPTPTPSPSLTAPAASGITGWTPYTSEVYGLTFAYPDDWRLGEAATERWKPGTPPEGTSYLDWFANPADRDGDEVVFSVWQQPAGSGAEITSRDDLAAWVQANWCNDQTDACETVPDVALPMCVGRTACDPAILVPWTEDIVAAFPATERGMVNLVMLWRHDSFHATVRYGGGVQLLKSILTTMDVWTPEPGQVQSP